MGLLHIKDTLSMTPPPASGPAQGTVDRLATFFLSKFQETKKEGDLSTLQCTTQVKFEALEKMLGEQTLTVAALRSDMKAEIQSEIQSFRDKAASYFLEKFSAQLDAMGAGRGEKYELALSRLEHRVDDEVKHLSDQLSDISTKLAISSASLNASIDDAARKLNSANDNSAENLRRCESEFRSKISRLESLFESHKTEATIERDKLSRMLQDTNKRLQSKVDNLELAVMRQSEELASQGEKIDHLEDEIRKLSQLGLGQEKSHATVVRMLSTQREELSKLAQNWQNHAAVSTVLNGSRSNPTPDKLSASYLASTPKTKHVSIKALKGPTLQVLGNRKKMKNDYQISLEKEPIQRKRVRGPRQATSFDMSQPETESEASKPSPKRVKVNKDSSVKVANEGVAAVSFTPSKASTPTKTPQQTVAKTPGVQDMAVKPLVVAVSNAINKGKGSQPPQVKASQAKETKRPTPAKRLEEMQKGSPTLINKPLSLQWNIGQQPYSEARSEQNEASPRHDKQYTPPKATQPASDLSSTPAKASTTKRDRNSRASPSTSSSPSNKKQNFANRREATVAFMMHVQSSARAFSTSPPRSERQFIWSFLEDIPDRAWSEFMQKRLLEAYPTSVRPSLGIRAKHSINFDSGLTWRHVLELIRNLQQKPPSAS